MSPQTEVRPPFHSRDPGVSRFAPEKGSPLLLQFLTQLATLMDINKHQHQQAPNIPNQQTKHPTSSIILLSVTVIYWPSFVSTIWPSQTPTNRRQVLEAIILGESSPNCQEQIGGKIFMINPGNSPPNCHF